MQEMSQLHAIFSRTRGYIDRFAEIIQPIIDAAQDEHTRLYYHHILEEEEQRLGRLQELIPYIGSLDEAKKRNSSATANCPAFYPTSISNGSACTIFASIWSYLCMSSKTRKPASS